MKSFHCLLFIFDKRDVTGYFKYILHFFQGFTRNIIITNVFNIQNPNIGNRFLFYLGLKIEIVVR